MFQNNINNSINIPNSLTVARILLTPYFVKLLFDDRVSSSLIVFIIAAVTDGLDGFIARQFKQQTRLGSYLDPIADKILIDSAYISLGILNIIPEWLMAVVLVRDATLIIGVLISRIIGVNVDIKPSFAGKCSTFVQLSTIFFALLESSISTSLLLLKMLYGLTAGLTVITGVHYIYLRRVK